MNGQPPPKKISSPGIEILATAMSKARERRPDLIIADIRLRGVGNGISAVQEQGFVPVVFATGNRQELLRRGMGHLAVNGKPFMLSALQQAVRVALSSAE